MQITILASGSKGNGTLIETERGNILIDAGIAYKHFSESFEKYGSPNVLFITHSHGDHIQSAGTIGRRLSIPVYLHSATYQKTQSKFEQCDVKFVDPGVEKPVKLFNDTIQVTAFSTQHDCEACVGYIIEDLINHKKLCYITDTGSFTKVMYQAISGCDAYIIETDYDEQLLEESDYDQLLKDRISSDFGHLSNQQVIELLKTLPLKDLSFVALVHLSRNTNSPERVQELFSKAFPDEIHKIHIEPLNTPIVL